MTNEQESEPTQQPSRSPLADMGSDYTSLPGRHVTLNQVVAYNMAYFRKAAGLTQEELAERLIGWTSTPMSKATVSAAERSWDGKRIRQFDADLVFGLARVLDVPVAALYLPPNTDGVDQRYLIDPPHPGGGRFTCLNMHDLLIYALSDPTDDAEPTMKAYRERLLSAADMYLGARLPDDYFEELTMRETLESKAVRFREQYEALRGVLGDLEASLEWIYERMRKEPRPDR